MTSKRRKGRTPVRIIYTSADNVHRVDSVQENPNAIFAVVGPFAEHTSEPELQDALTGILRKHNGFRKERPHG